MIPSAHEVTQLLADWHNGKQDALDRLMPLVYDELRRLAKRYMAREGRGHTLRTTALVNKAFLCMIDQGNVTWQNRAHFFAVAARLMRHLLVDHARTRHYDKGGEEHGTWRSKSQQSSCQNATPNCWPSARRLRGWLR